MTPRSKIIVTLSLLVFLGALGAADFFITNDVYVADVTGDNGTDGSESSAMSIVTTSLGVKKGTGPNVDESAKNLGFTTEESSDLTFLSQVASEEPSIHSLTLIKDNDRAGSVTWIESPSVKKHFVALKEALIGSFSSDVKDLKDTTEELPNEPTRNILTFLDPALSTERMIFVRVRERLYEFHVVMGKEDSVQGLIEEVTK